MSSESGNNHNTDDVAALLAEEDLVEKEARGGQPIEDDSLPNGVAGADPAADTTTDIGPESSSLLLSGTKRPREDRDGSTNAEQHEDTVTAVEEEEADLTNKRQKTAPAGSTGESMIEKLKTETEQLIENPEQTLGPDLVLPGEQGITAFHDNDVLSGRGGGTNVHPGNRNFRDLINMHRRLYLKARKNDKPAISRAIVRSIRNNDGRFLKKDEKSGFWYEIGDDAAREKTSQALRQRAPEMRKILFDTEREEARVATEQHLRQHQQRMMMGMVPPHGAGTALPAMSIAPAAMHPGMMAYAPGAMAPMMFVNPAMFMQPPQQQPPPQQQQQPGATTNAASATVVQPTMQPMMMMDPYQQAAMFQFMANPMLMNPFMQQFQPPAQQSPQSNASTQPANGNAPNDQSNGISQTEKPAHSGTTDLGGNAESPSLQEAKRVLCGSETNSVSDQTVVNSHTSAAEDVPAADSYGEEHIAAI